MKTNDQLIDMDASMNAKKQRPVLVTIICILGFLGIVLGLMGGIALLTTDMSVYEGLEGMPEMPSKTLTILSLALLPISFVSLIGLWKMKKWGVHLYVLLQVISLGLAAVMATFSVISVVIPAIIIVLLFTQYKNMD